MNKFINVENCIDNIERIYCEKCPGDNKHRDSSYYMKYTCTNCLSPFNIDFLKHYIECESFITFDNER